MAVRTGIISGAFRHAPEIATSLLLFLFIVLLLVDVF
jgi:hypothetical protein